MGPTSLCSVFVTWLVAVAVASAQGPARPPAAAAVERFTLSNGLQVVLQHDPNAPGVAGAVAYGVGSRDDPPGYAGLAHLVEHMAMRGSRHLPGMAAAAQYAAIGAQYNGLTQPDRTIFVASFPAAYLPHFLWIESDRMAFSLEWMDEEALAVERKLVRNEYRGRSFEQRVRQVLQRTLTPLDHPYRYIEEPIDPDELGLDDVRGFFQRHYRPDNAELVLVGRLDLARTRALIERYFGTLRATGALAARPPAPAIAFAGSERLRFATGGAARPELHLFWSVPCARDVACLARQSLLGALLERTLSPEARTGVRFRSLDVNTARYAQHVEFRISAELYSQSDADRVLAQIDRELQRLRAGQLDAQALSLAQHALATEWHYAQESLWTRALTLLEDVDAGAVLESAQRLTVRDLTAAAAKLLPRNRRLVVEIRRLPNGSLEGDLMASEGELSPELAGSGARP